MLGRMGRQVSHAWRYARLAVGYARATGVFVPASVLGRDFAAWCDNLQPDRSPVGDRAPWITFGARRRLERMVAAGARVFEYGAGDSTLFFLDRGLSFRRYVHFLGDYALGTFDVVMVDGRARGPCLAIASRLVAAHGLLILDNSERPRYAPAITAVERDGWRTAHFHGPGPYVIREFWNTTVFTRDPADGGRGQPSAATDRS